MFSLAVVFIYILFSSETMLSSLKFWLVALRLISLKKRIPSLCKECTNAGDSDSGVTYFIFPVQLSVGYDRIALVVFRHNLSKVLTSMNCNQVKTNTNVKRR